MGFKIFMLVVAVAAPLMMTAVGAVFSKSAPKTINAVFGYRTAMSMKNEDTWAFAHHYCGRMWLVCGVVFTVLTAALMAFAFKKEENTFGVLAAALCFLCVLGMVWSVVLTERALKETFDEEGNRRALTPIVEVPASIAAQTDAEQTVPGEDIDAEDAFFEATADAAWEEPTADALEDSAEEPTIFDE